MPRLKLTGSQIDLVSVGPRQVPALPASKAAVPPIQIDKYLRNGFHPNAQLWNQLMEATNQGALFRTREVFRSPGMLTPGPVGSFGAGSRARWRFAYRSSTYAHALMAVFVMSPPTAGTAQNTYGKLTLFSDTAEATPVLTGTAYYGNGPTGTTVAAGWQYLKTVMVPIDGITPSTQYYARFDDVDWGIIQSCSVFELHSMTENFSGYLSQNLTSQSDIVDVYREKVATMQKNLWKGAGGLTLLFTCEDGASPRTVAVNTPTNVVDNTTTTTADPAPGYKIDLTNHDRLMQTSGIPVVMKVFAKTTSGTGKGRFYLKNSAGTTILSITDGLSATATWYSVSGYLPASADTYYLMYDNNSSGTLSCYAMSLYEYET